MPLVTPKRGHARTHDPGRRAVHRVPRAKRRGQVGGSGDQDALIGAGVAGGTPASIGVNAISAGGPGVSVYAGQSQAPAYAGTVGGTVGTGGAGSVAVAAGGTTAGDSGAVLKKRAVHEQAHLERRLAVAVEAVEAEPLLPLFCPRAVRLPRPRRVLPVRCVDRAVALAVCPALRAVLVALPVRRCCGRSWRRRYSTHFGDS